MPILHALPRADGDDVPVLSTTAQHRQGHRLALCKLRGTRAAEYDALLPDGTECKD